MTKEDYADLQKEWEGIEFTAAQLGICYATAERQKQIEMLMDEAPWQFDPDTNEVIPR